METILDKYAGLALGSLRALPVDGLVFFSLGSLEGVSRLGVGGYPDGDVVASTRSAFPLFSRAQNIRD